MPDLEDGASVEMNGSAAKPYVLRNTSGVYSCDCPAWRNQSVAIERRTCKHLRKLRGDAAEDARVGSATRGTMSGEGADGTAERKADDEAKAPPLLLAHPWENDVDLTGWWMSEKLDGVRAYWTGKHFLSRLGNVYHAPDWFLAGLPEVPLDGELWCGRKKFQRCVSVVRRQDKSEHWRELTYVVFDAPAMKAPFEERLAFVEEHMQSRTPPHAQHHAHARCEGDDHLRAELARVEGLGGEGLMLRQPGSSYEIGRSSTLLKVKSFRDAEAPVLEHIPGAGRHKGRLGALGVEMADGTRFSIGTGLSDAERAAPPPVGAIVTFRYQELSDGGVPRFPSYVGVRHDGVVIPARGSAQAPGPEGAATRSPAPAPLAAPTPAAAAATAPMSTASPHQKRRFELSDGSSNKFWELEVRGTEQVVRFGRIGTSGQTKSKTFASREAARASSEALVAERLAKGYVEST